MRVYLMVMTKKELSFNRNPLPQFPLPPPPHLLSITLGTHNHNFSVAPLFVDFVPFIEKSQIRCPKIFSAVRS